jgi:hypothetical protein
MNILLLSPDGVGGTLLERLLTIYMQLHQFDRPVIDLAHPEEGIESYFSPEFSQNILRSNRARYQELSEVVDLYNSVDHYTVSKLTYYTMRHRKDPVSQLVPFYQYFNDNFFVIACRRENVFEHALSWGISKISKAKNVYNHPDKILTFIDFYQEGVELDPQSFIDTLETYKEYLQWVNDYFSPASYYYYEKNIFDIEKYILSLPIFNGQPCKKTWKDVFGISFNDWNRCHFLASDIGSIALNNPDTFSQIANSIKNNIPIESTAELSWTMPRTFVQAYNDVADPSWPQVQSIKDFEALPDYIKQECSDLHHITHKLDHANLHRNVAVNLDPGRRQFLAENADNYLKAVGSIEKMLELNILVTNPPIKKQTLAEKKLIVKNFDQCVEVYNNWIQQNPSIGSMVTSDQLLLDSETEQKFWNTLETVSKQLETHSHSVLK